MDTMTDTAVRANLADTIERVCRRSLSPGATKQAVVVMSLGDFKVLEETACLLRVSKNALRLLEAIVSLEEGHGKERGLTKCS